MRAMNIRWISAWAALLLLGWGGGLAQWGSAGESADFWVSDPHDTDDGPQKSGSTELLIVGARNGGFSGKIVCAGAIGKATLGDLTQGSAVIPASCIQVRYGRPEENRHYAQYRPPGNDLLLEQAEGVAKSPIWVTVQVPKDAKAGTYTGQLAFGGQHLPLKLVVHDWTLPDTQDYQTWVELVQSPDTLSLEYGAPLWSDRHWDLIAKSLELMSCTGSRVLYVPLIEHTNYGNAESMVRWIKKGDHYEYDFSLMEKYLDLAEKKLGKVKLIQFYTWEVFLKPASARWKQATADGETVDPHAKAAAARNTLEGKGAPVTLLDPTTGKTDRLFTPRYETAEGKAVWKPLFDELRTRLKKRDLEKALMIGMATDEWPTKDEVVALKEITSDAPWTACAHHLNCIVPFKSLGDLYKVSPFGYAAVALDFYCNLNPAKGGQHYGWNQPLTNQYWRFQFFNAAPKNAYVNFANVRYAAEVQLTGNKHGLGHIGADFWPCLKDKKGVYVTWTNERFPESFWHNLQIQSWLLGPGPTGPVGTARLEIFREGIQECEARIVIEKALMDPAVRPKLSPELAQRAQDFLDNRLVDLWKSIGVADADLKELGLVTEYRKWYFEISKRANRAAGMDFFTASNWRERQGKLFDLAAEVQAKVGGK